MDVEQALINTMIATGDMSPVHEQGIKPELFYNTENRKVLRMFIRLAAEYSQVPTIVMMRAEFPSYKFDVLGKEGIPWLVDEVRENHRSTVIQDTMNDVVDLFKTNSRSDDAVEMFRKMLAQVDVDLPSAKDINLKGSGEQRLADYLAINEDEVQGILSNFSLIDHALGGFKPGQLITWVGPPKAGKSSALLSAALAAGNARVPVYFQGFEMGNTEQAQRADAMQAGISHKHLTRGLLTRDEEKALRKSVRAMDLKEDFWFSTDTTGKTLSGIATKIERYRPRIVFVDGVYMMDDEYGEPQNTSQALTNITRGFKRMAQHYDIPICISTQVLTWKMDKKRGITDNSIGYSSSFAQDSDAVIGVERVEDDDVTRRLKIVLARNAAVGSETYIRWDWDAGKYDELEGNPFEEQESPDGPQRF